MNEKNLNKREVPENDLQSVTGGSEEDPSDHSDLDFPDVLTCRICGFRFDDTPSCPQCGWTLFK